MPGHARTPRNPQKPPSRDGIATAPDNRRQAFASRLWKLMTEKGLNQSQLSAKSGVLKESISTYLKGVNKPGAANLTRLAKALDVSPDELDPESPPLGTEPILEIRRLLDDPKRAVLVIRQTLPITLAMEIAAMITKADDVRDGTA